MDFQKSHLSWNVPLKETILDQDNGQTLPQQVAIKACIQAKTFEWTNAHFRA